MNGFEVGSHIEWNDGNTSRIDIILWIEASRSHCFCIDTDRNKSSVNPVHWPVADIELALATARAKVVPESSVADALSLLQGPHFQSYLDHRDRAWTIIEPLVRDSRIFDLKLRGKLIRTRAEEMKVTPKVILKYLRRYWQAGQKKNALLPHYEKCGGSRKIRRARPGVKRGRPSALKVKSDIQTGINVDEEVRRKFRKGIALYYENQSGATLRKAYDDTIRWLFNVGIETIDGVDYPILPPAQQRPQFAQFRYWYYRERSFSRSIVRRHGKEAFNLNHRALGSDATHDAFGPASIFELDSTVADIYVVSALDRNRILGRPVLYFVKDLFSRLIVGMGVSLHGPSWETAMIAVENTMMDKVAFCQAFGITISPELWPSQHLPRAIRADRGEFLSKNSDMLVNILDVQIDTTAPYRPDWKGMIEQHFKLMNDMTIHWLPGQSNNVQTRSGKDYRYDACLTLYELRQILISSVIEYNTTQWLDTYRKDEDMIADHVSPIPIKLWEWGVQNRSGILRTEKREKVRLALLPRGQASLTATGLHFKGADYCCDRAKAEEWREKARQKRVHIPVCYDPRNMDAILLRLDEMDLGTFHFLSADGKRDIEEASLMKKDLRFSGCDWQDSQDYFAMERQVKALAQTQTSQQQSDQQAFREHIISEASEKTAQARAGKSKASRVLDMTALKRQENDAERVASAWTPHVTTSTTSQSLSQDDRHKQEEYEWLERMRSAEGTDGH